MILRRCIVVFCFEPKKKKKTYGEKSEATVVLWCSGWISLYYYMEFFFLFRFGRRLYSALMCMECQNIWLETTLIRWTAAVAGEKKKKKKKKQQLFWLHAHFFPISFFPFIFDVPLVALHYPANASNKVLHVLLVSKSMNNLHLFAIRYIGFGPLTIAQSAFVCVP